MPLHPHHSHAVKSLGKIIDEFRQYKHADLVRKDLGPLSFEGVEGIFRNATKLVDQLEDVGFGNILRKSISEIIQRIGGMTKLYREVAEFSISTHKENPSEFRDQMQDKLENAYYVLQRCCIPLIAYEKHDQIDVDQLSEKTKKEVEDAIMKVNTELYEIQEIKKDSEGLLEAQRQAVVETSISAYAKIFNDQATEHDAAAKKWLKATIYSSITILTVSIAFMVVYLFELIEVSSVHVVQIAITKIIFFSLLSYTILFCARNYRAHMHNAVANKHRNNALKTFDAFSRSANDEATKNAVLIRTTEAIFSLGNSGYGDAKDSSKSTSHVFEILKSSIPKNN